ncbi:FAD-dependent monooxygenase [Bacillus cereus]|uniref:FAD-dependent monooxygenase n=1 Tax=Bacillus cereus TaxID=1396 RepID=UPI000BFDFCF0|nr:FAD-dependent monooxygenase [Bacillus cereus]PGK39835.1 hypothetical protein CN909_24390 [Bacillus cereus]
METKTTDVIVVGAGPGGCILSYLLARSGVQTVLVERHEDLSKEFRGYFFQPLVLDLFNQMGLLQDILKLTYQKVEKFQFIDHKKLLFEICFNELAPPYNYGINMPQDILLNFFIQKSSEFSNFTFLKSTQVRKLIESDGNIKGVMAKNKTTDLNIYGRLIIGSDGRYSTIRKSSGITHTNEKFQFDLIWFDIPRKKEVEHNLQMRIEDKGMLIYIPKGSDLVQVGWLIRKGEYSQLRKKGIDYFHEQLIGSDISLKENLSTHLKDFSDCSILDINVSMADTWTKNGLMLIGDAAHTASPFSGQGNSLAIQDAVIAHDVIMKALIGQKEGTLSCEILKAFEFYRRPAVVKIQKIQQMQANLVSLNGKLLSKLRRQVVPLMSKTNFFEKMRDKIALGVQPVNVNTCYFTDNKKK